MKIDSTVQDCCICNADYESLVIDCIDGKFQVVCEECTTSTSKLYLDKKTAIAQWNLMCSYYKNS